MIVKPARKTRVCPRSMPSSLKGSEIAEKLIGVSSGVKTPERNTLFMSELKLRPPKSRATYADRSAAQSSSSTRFSTASFFILCVATFLVLTSVPTMKAQDEKQKCPPVTRTDDVQDDLHGTKVADPYRWLEDQNSAETRAWIEAQNKCTESVLGQIPGRGAIEKRLGELLRVDRIDVPVEHGGRYFYSKRLATQDLTVLYMRRGANGAEDVLVDPAQMSADHTTSVNFQGISRDGKLAAYGVRKGGEDEVTIHIIDTDTHKELSDSLPRNRYFSGLWFNADNSVFYYSRYSAEGPRILYHALGADADHDTKIFGDGLGPEKILDVSASEDRRYLLMTIAYGSACEKTELYFQDLKNKGPIQTAVKTIEACFQGRIAGDTLYVLTNYKAPNWRLISVPLAHPAEENWKEVIPEGKERLQAFHLIGGKIGAEYTHDATTDLKLFEANGTPAGNIALPSLGTAGRLEGSWSGNEAFLSFESFALPPTIYRYDVAKGALAVWAKPGAAIDSDNYEVKQVWYESKDKTRVPMFLFCRKGLKMDGARPTLMTAYGGFDVSLTPTFSADAIVWVDQGGVYAVPNLRGGGEFGEAWHHAGTLERKQNVFDDFFAAAEWLEKNGYTRPDKLAIEGRSNGGLLMGAAMTQRPELFGAILCGYPLLDMIRYQKFLVARYWVPEYGTSDDASQFPFLYAYSPYHHVVPGTKYPAILFLTGDSDTRVAPLHARKMTARMQAAQDGDKPILLHYDTKLGHSEGRPVAKVIAEDTQILSFLLTSLGVRIQ
jgi:prolyl oligopeptidase